VRSSIASACRALVAAAACAAGLGAAAPAGAAAGAGDAPEAAAPAPPEGTLTLETLMARMAATSGVRARFRERKEVALLSRPLESEGVLFFVPPRRLARFTTAPTEQAFVIDGERLSFHDAAGGDRVDLSRNAVARTVVENFVVLFGGDLAALRARYETQFAADGPRWRLGLVPRDARVRAVLSRVDLAGEGPKLLEMAVSEAEGDRTVTTFPEVAVDVRFDAATLARAFPQDGSRPRP